ncbi:hypothetical protein [Teredinibacter franksiae]|uniref:hypothetical protein n=1 Tax=Teredinibacter franksiae TaxID=2761453 RepID=UPI001626EDDE|nr:hypothetical protein [Teredinibacter franksiae]
MFPAASVLFTDINKDMLLKLDASLPLGHSCSIGVSDLSLPDHVTLLDGKKLVIERHTYDIINASANMGYSLDPEKTIAILYGALKPGGVILNLEMNCSVWGRIVSWVYGYRILQFNQICISLASTGAKVSKRRISFRYFPLNLTRECILIEKPVQHS